MLYGVDRSFSQNGRAYSDIILPPWVLGNDLGMKIPDSSQLQSQAVMKLLWASLPEVRNRDSLIHVPQLPETR